MSLTCHYCGEEYEATTAMEKSYAADDQKVCSTCLFDVLTNDEELEPLPEYAHLYEEGDR